MSFCPRCILKEGKEYKCKIEVDRLQPSPLLINVTTDLTGPFLIQHKEKKILVLVYFSNISKDLHLQLVENYSAKTVTTPLTSIFAIRNLSQKIIFDCILEQKYASINNRPLGLNIMEHTVLNSNQLLLSRNCNPKLLMFQDMNSSSLYYFHMFATLWQSCFKGGTTLWSLICQKSINRKLAL